MGLQGLVAHSAHREGFGQLPQASQSAPVVMLQKGVDFEIQEMAIAAFATCFRFTRFPTPEPSAVE